MPADAEDSQASSPAAAAPSHRPRTGPYVIAGMFLFAITVTTGLWTYWNLHTSPYRPLTDALGREFPGSSPRVEGGKHGMHRNTPRVLRIVMRVTFDPHADDEQFAEQTDAILQLAREHVDMSEYDHCEMHLFQQLPEQEASLRSRTIDLETGQDAAPSQ